ncbi:MAG: carotenoid biosynthesis protein [Candidatus Helarchaeota archaeon]
MERHDKIFLLIVFSFLGICITISTIIHDIYPWIFQVPSVAPPVLYGTLTTDVILTDCGAIFAAAIVFRYSYKKDGLWRSILFLTGSFIFTGFEEAMWILSGRFGLTFPTYFFSRGGLWFFEVPLYTLIGWYVIAYSCVFLSKKLLSNRTHLFQAILGAGLAVSFDLWTDPVMVNLYHASIVPANAGMWVWLMSDTLLIFGIPFMNFLGWFLIIFLFAIIWEVVPDKKREWGFWKTTTIFYALIPLLLLICLVVLGGIEIGIIRNLIGG